MSPGDLYRRDPAAYLQAVRDFEASYEWSEDEHARLGWLAYSVGGRPSEEVGALVAVGYLAGLTERVSEVKRARPDDERQRQVREDVVLLHDCEVGRALDVADAQLVDFFKPA